MNGEPPYGQPAPLQGFVISYSTKEILDSFSPDTQVLINKYLHTLAEHNIPPKHGRRVIHDGCCDIAESCILLVVYYNSYLQLKVKTVHDGGL